MSYYLPAAAPVRLPVPLKNRSVAGAKVNLAVRLHWWLPPQPCVTENRLGGINTTAWGSVDRSVCARVLVCVSVDEWKWGRGRFVEEVLCSQSIIFREESHWIKVASCHFRDVRQIPADRVNTAVRVCVLSSFCRQCQSFCQPVSLYCFFNLPLTFLKTFRVLPQWKRNCNEKKEAPAACSLCKNTAVSTSACP